MIVLMEEEAGKDALEPVVRILMDQGYSVKIADIHGDGFAIALLGTAAQTVIAEAIMQMPGVKKCTHGAQSAQFYRENFTRFVAPEGFFNWGY